MCLELLQCLGETREGQRRTDQRAMLSPMGRAVAIGADEFAKRAVRDLMLHRIAGQAQCGCRCLASQTPKPKQSYSHTKCSLPCTKGLGCNRLFGCTRGRRAYTLHRPQPFQIGRDAGASILFVRGPAWPATPQSLLASPPQRRPFRRVVPSSLLRVCYKQFHHAVLPLLQLQP